MNVKFKETGHSNMYFPQVCEFLLSALTVYMSSSYAMWIECFVVIVAEL